MDQLEQAQFQVKRAPGGNSDRRTCADDLQIAGKLFLAEQEGGADGAGAFIAEIWSSSVCSPPSWP